MDWQRARECCGVTGDPRAEDGTGLRGGRGSKFEKLKLSGSHASQRVTRTRITSAFLSSSRVLCNGYDPLRESYTVFVVGHIFKALTAFEVPTGLSRIPPGRSKKPLFVPIPQSTPFSHKLVTDAHGMVVIYYLLGAALDTYPIGLYSSTLLNNKNVLTPCLRVFFRVF